MINIVRQWMHVPTLKLRAGEMTAQEVRTVLAVLGAICAEMELKADPDLCEDEGCPHSDIPHGHNPAVAPEGCVHFQTDFYDVAKDSFPSITPAAAAEPPEGEAERRMDKASDSEIHAFNCGWRWALATPAAAAKPSDAELEALWFKVGAERHDTFMEAFSRAVLALRTAGSKL